MRPIHFLFLLILSLSCLTSCIDMDDDIKDGDICHYPGEQFCRDDLLMSCHSNYPDGIIYKWHTYRCDPGAYCQIYGDKADCFERCTKEELNQRNERDTRQICTRIGRDGYFYVY